MHLATPAPPRAAVAAAVLCLVTVACGPTAPVSEAAGAPADAAAPTSPPASPTTPPHDVGSSTARLTQPPAGVAAARSADTAGRTPAPSPPTPRAVTGNDWTPFATVGGVVLHHPSSRVERVGFHESNHDGARQLEVLDTAVAPVVLDSRERDTGSRTAADVVVDPGVEVRAPVTGTVLRAGTYVLYCDHRDDYAVIEPDDHPGWEVKVLHIDGVQVAEGARVQAGVTVLAAGPTPLPFDSQVDDHTAEPSWPHVHLEVVDPSIPDRPSDGDGC